MFFFLHPKWCKISAINKLIEVRKTLQCLFHMFCLWKENAMSSSYTKLKNETLDRKKRNISCQKVTNTKKNHKQLNISFLIVFHKSTALDSPPTHPRKKKNIPPRRKNNTNKPNQTNRTILQDPLGNLCFKKAVRTTPAGRGPTRISPVLPEAREAAKGSELRSQGREGCL